VFFKQTKKFVPFAICVSVFVISCGSGGSSDNTGYMNAGVFEGVPEISGKVCEACASSAELDASCQRLAESIPYVSPLRIEIGFLGRGILCATRNLNDPSYSDRYHYSANLLDLTCVEGSQPHEIELSDTIAFGSDKNFPSDTGCSGTRTTNIKFFNDDTMESREELDLLCISGRAHYACHATVKTALRQIAESI
jgi:hypothetical protein